jgi:hypothetical protein
LPTVDPEGRSRSIGIAQSAGGSQRPSCAIDEPYPREHVVSFREDNAHDVFISWFMAKSFSVTGAYVDLGNIATHPDQRGWYLALQTSF